MPIGTFHYSTVSPDQLIGNSIQSTSFVTRQPTNIILTGNQALELGANATNVGPGTQWWAHQVSLDGVLVEQQSLLPTSYGPMMNIKLLSNAPVINSTPCPAQSMIPSGMNIFRASELRSTLSEAGGTFGVLMMIGNELPYDIIWATEGKAAADEFELQRELGHPPTPTEIWIAQGGA